MESISIKIDNFEGISRSCEPVSVGVPMPVGEVKDINFLELQDENEAVVPAQFSPLASWKDGSLKWVLVDFQASVAAGSSKKYSLSKIETPPVGASKGINIDEDENHFSINTGAAKFSLDKRNLRPFTEVKNKTCDILHPDSAKIILTAADDTEFLPKINKIAVLSSGFLKTTLKAEGMFSNNGKNLLDFIVRFHFFKDKSFVKIDFTLWNKGPAKHVGGLWDLGDPGSVLFKSLSFKLSAADEIAGGKWLRPELEQDFDKIDVQTVSIYQDSSGGENWQSTNHVNRDQQIPVRFRGYKISQNDQIVSEGLRASPIIAVGDQAKCISAALKNFWQNFPKAISVNHDEIVIHLFPGQFADLHELQGGERKTHTIFLDFGGEPEALSFVYQPLRCALSRQWYAQTDVVPYLSRAGTEEDRPYNELLELAVSGEKSFFAGREEIDEYGWRNFGEVYANHEAVGYAGKTPLISHYNNQYDQVYGFFREYIACGNGAWFELMDDLVRHVADIDIYYTQKDRDEYNNGLHWHTNHYLDAVTCTHRSVSKGHLDKHDPQFYGGGPGMEHCYASGFMYHYFITGEVASRDALLTLADWICNCISNADTILGVVYKLKSMLPQWKQALAGKRIRADRYPLTRGSGNPLSALLDAFLLSSDKIYLRKAEEIVKGCIHPHDDIESRDLLDAENGWSYNICLQAIGKYLDVKISINELDYMYAYAQASLLHYATWMLEYEYPYLEKTEILEFPNETWPAQDLRKSCVFYFAAKHSTGKLKERFLKKAAFFHNYVISKLNEFETRSLARPIALLMQNRWMHAYFAEHPDETASSLATKYEFARSHEFWTKRAILKKTLANIFYALQRTSLNKEKYWLRCRKGEHV